MRANVGRRENPFLFRCLWFSMKFEDTVDGTVSDCGKIWKTAVERVFVR